MDVIKGFNLIEVLIVLALVSVLGIIAIPSFQTYFNNFRLEHAGQQLYEVLVQARGEAQKRNLTTYVSFISGTSWCYGTNTTSACTCTTATSCNLGTVKSPNAKELTLSTTGLTSNALSFEPIKGATFVKRTLTFTANNAASSISVVVSTGGNIVVCSNSLPGYSACT